MAAPSPRHLGDLAWEAHTRVSSLQGLRGPRGPSCRVCVPGRSSLGEPEGPGGRRPAKRAAGQSRHTLRNPPAGPWENLKPGRSCGSGAPGPVGRERKGGGGREGAWARGPSSGARRRRRGFRLVPPLRRHPPARAQERVASIQAPATMTREQDGCTRLPPCYSRPLQPAFHISANEPRAPSLRRDPTPRPHPRA